MLEKLLMPSNNLLGEMMNSTATEIVSQIETYDAFIIKERRKKPSQIRTVL